MSDEDGKEILQAMGLGLISGYSDHSLKPNNTATRGEACTMILRLLEKDKRIFPDVNTPYVTTDIVKTGYDLGSLLPNYPDFVNNFNGTKYVLLENGNRFSFKFLHSHQNANTISNPNSPRGYSYYFSSDDDSGYLWALCNGKAEFRLALSYDGDLITGPKNFLQVADYFCFVPYSDTSTEPILYIFPNPYKQ